MWNNKLIRITLSAAGGLAFALTFLTLNLTCSNLVAPEDIQPGRRDYVWTVDTLIIPYTYLYRIWGSSPNDVWLVGPGGDLDKTIYHFNGVKWTNDGISRSISPRSIWGFGEKEVWIGGQNGKIWKFDGTNWRENYVFSMPGTYDIQFQFIWGNRPNNIYAVGFVAYNREGKRDGIILKYNGVNWRLIKLLQAGINSQFFRVTGTSKSDKVYIAGLIEDGKEETSKVYMLDGNNFIEIYSNEEFSTIRSIGDEIFFIVGEKVYKYSMGRLKHFININSGNFDFSVHGRNEKDIFVQKVDGVVHYNGNDFEYVFLYPSDPVNTFLFEKDVFFLARDLAGRGLNLIIKGKLN